MKKINYAIGDCIAIPLRNGGFARGVIARVDGKGKVFGYFFSPKFNLLSDIVYFDDLVCKNAILCGRFGDLGLLCGEWKVVGKIKEWSKEAWSLPPFIRIDEIANRAWMIYYDDNLSVIKEEEVTVECCKGGFPCDILMGYGSLEIKLTKLIEELSCR